MKPKQFFNFIIENTNQNGTLKSTFITHYLGKFSDEELQGIKISLDKEISRRQQFIIEEKINFLASLGYKVSK
jgi:hypothetical protein